MADTQKKKLANTRHIKKKNIASIDRTGVKSFIYKIRYQKKCSVKAVFIVLIARKSNDADYQVKFMYCVSQTFPEQFRILSKIR